ncbi:WD repeat protein [Talaromyces stipitatus ATCC 10500]|uniref:WD repeat protein n=1 Tax=Talaromyces stipitatus (strain ATCC 10500 / CBS 375.48 / QM 6759 / NRRL 1006) TaxID=441959 RepID=B8LYL0_TALSN|nr:WD repeat protein [Talaromyces stipitatus ATCC 10500]EED23368.1 WD repeat protein [Talaromyces stipitatus ATCC 10500]
MKISTQSSVPVYTISGSSTARPLPEWLARRRKRSLKNDPEYANRVELLQDFEFEEASQCIRISEDGQWVMSTGTYKPQIHTHYLPHLSLSFARHTVSLNTTFLLLSSDYSKSLHLQADRSLEFHTPSGCHYTTRLPRYGRDLIYDRQSTEALVPSVGVNQDGLGEVFRLNLEAGRYMRSYEVDVGGDDYTSAGGGALQGGINTGSINTGAIAEGSHNLLAFGTSIGTVELWDSRARGRAGILLPPAQSQPGEGRHEITALEFHRSGLTLGTGSSNGLIHLYDLRSPIPFLKKDQGYGYPVHTLKFLQSSSQTREQTMEPKILSSDKRIIKIWDPRNGTPWTSVEPAVDINSVAWYPDSGMILTANEGRQQHAFFVPQLGPAPKWCSFLDNLVEEMAEDPNDPQAFTGGQTSTVYDNYKFLTVPQLRTLNLDHLIGRTNLLRPYMHGYFVAQRLYEEARLITNPYIWEEERAKRVKEKIDQERESRIRGKKKVAVKVNRKLAEKLLEKQEKAERRNAKRVLEQGGDETMAEAPEQSPETTTGDESKGLLGDSRFAKLFEDEEFAVDETSREFQMLNPSTTVEKPERKERGLTAVEQEEADEIPGSSSDDDDNDSDDAGSEQGQKPSNRPAKANQPKMGEEISYKRSRKPYTKMQVSSSSSSANKSRGGGRDRSFETLAHKLGSNNTHRVNKDRATSRQGAVGEKEITFAPTSSKSRSQQQSRSDYSGTDNGYRNKARRSASGNTFRRI